MSVTLIQPALSASAVPLFAYNPPSPPNVYNCDEYYAYPSPPLIADCRQAFKLLPNGPTPEPFYTEPGADRQHVLPLSVHYGTCEIILHTSGPAAPKDNPTFIVPNDIRNMAGYLMAKCVFVRKGGMITKNLANAIDFLLDTDDPIDFDGDPFPISSSFLSLHIWNHAGPDPDIDWNPGDNDPTVGKAIQQSLRNAFRAAQPGSARRMELGRRDFYVGVAADRMRRGDDRAVWWTERDVVGLVGVGKGSGTVV